MRRAGRRRIAWLTWLGMVLTALAAGPGTSSSSAPGLLVLVECPDEATPTMDVVEDALSADDGCRRRPLAWISDQVLAESGGELETNSLAESDLASVTPTVKAGWPRSFPRFRAQTLATANLGDPRGRATILNEDTGLTHALAPDGTPSTGWPLLLPQLFGSVMPTSMNVDEQGPEEILLGSIELHLLSHEGVDWPAWPFRVPGIGFGTSPIASRLADGEPVRIVTGTGRGRLDVLDHSAQTLPGWPVTIPFPGPFVGLLAGIAVGDLDGNGRADVVAVGNSGTPTVMAHDDMGVPLLGFPATIGFGADEPTLADLDGDGTQEILYWASPAPGGKAGVVTLSSDGSLRPGWPRLSASGVGNSGVAAGDVDGDGDLEVLASTVNGGEPGAGGVYLWHHDGTPVSGWPKFFPNVSFPNPVVIADVDGDGTGDPVVGGFSVVSPIRGFVYAWKGNGQIIPGFPIQIIRPVGFGSPTIDDIDQDGMADLGITTTQALTILFPGHVYWYDLGVPYRAEGMEWPTRAHDMARTAAYRPPVRRVPMDVQLAPPQLNTRTPAPPLTVLLRLPPEESARPRILRLRFVNGERINEVEGQFLEDDGETVVFRLDGKAVRGLLSSPGEHTLGFWTEAVGGLDGVLYEGEAALTLRPMPVRPALPSSRDRGLRSPRIEAPAPVTPAPVRTINPTG